MEDNYISIPKDLDQMKVKTGILTKKQWIYLAIAFGAGFIAYQIATGLLGISIVGAAWIVIFVVIPIIMLGFNKREGLSMERMMVLKLRFWLFPSSRSFKKNSPTHRPNPQSKPQFQHKLSLQSKSTSQPIPKPKPPLHSASQPKPQSTPQSKSIHQPHKNQHPTKPPATKPPIIIPLSKQVQTNHSKKEVHHAPSHKNNTTNPKKPSKPQGSEPQKPTKLQTATTQQKPTTPVPKTTTNQPTAN
ncbi:MAG: PrgI family protein [Defluviitaleaceae bacterium]|nr:PrgI family protein [Defluviitaleaceae bacterium]